MIHLFHYREALHGAVMELMEEGDIEALEEKWFDDGTCATNEDTLQVRRPMAQFIQGRGV